MISVLVSGDARPEEGKNNCVREACLRKFMFAAAGKAVLQGF
jgi:hypothetical protein